MQLLFVSYQRIKPLSPLLWLRSDEEEGGTWGNPGQEVFLVEKYKSVRPAGKLRVTESQRSDTCFYQGEGADCDTESACGRGPRREAARGGQPQLPAEPRNCPAGGFELNGGYFSPTAMSFQKRALCSKEIDPRGPCPGEV